MDLDLRVATVEDSPALNALIPASVRGLSQGYYTPAQIESALVHHIFGVDSQLIADGSYFVVEHDDQIVGAGGWSKRKTLYGGDQLKSDADPLLDPAYDAAPIRAYFVHPEWARQGIGGRGRGLVGASCAPVKPQREPRASRGWIWAQPSRGRRSLARWGTRSASGWRLPCPMAPRSPMPR